ncbi:hypothetical protein BH09VER1_BH09VER1_32040 [soil metagenome]
MAGRTTTCLRSRVRLHFREIGSPAWNLRMLPPLGSRARVQSALECIEGRLANPPTVSEMAALSHASPSHFIRTFRRMVGLTPSQYYLERRIATDAQWLLESSRTIDQIAKSVGFTDRFQFFQSLQGSPRDTACCVPKASLLGCKRSSVVDLRSCAPHPVAYWYALEVDLPVPSAGLQQTSAIRELLY